MIYTITTVEHPKERTNIKGGKYMHRDMRTVGYALDLKEAQHWVTSNVMDLYECGYYPLVVIEAMPEGIYPMVNTEYGEWWYAWDGHGYCNINKPDEFERTVGFGMG